MNTSAEGNVNKKCPKDLHKLPFELLQCGDVTAMDNINRNSCHFGCQYILAILPSCPLGTPFAWVL